MIDAIAQFLSRIVVRFIHAITGAVENVIQTLDLAHYSGLQVALDVLLVAIIFYWIILFLRGTRATNIMIGLFILVLIFAISRFFNLLALGWLLDRLLTVVLIAIPIIFQQELRRGLARLGRNWWFNKKNELELGRIEHTAIEAAYALAEKKHGALIVFAGVEDLKEYIDTGVQLDAEVTVELLRSIFQPRSPLHDGAVIIARGRIIAAACVLPQPIKESGHAFGTRHKAALGLSEVSDAKIIVVSEERGTVSFVEDGKMQKDIQAEKMQTNLAKAFLVRT
ncbi:TIGR00159 family protein [Candidatus Peregrinibacteria bacterium CG11_big_fil_rev_8_21_14_0_20_46_8]|nr:MAG: TIGR00159 family protein [Candidatus Peregrinibacteria bacterium CG11_big_fil_rev_8_21_14_0_20_46_8]